MSIFVSRSRKEVIITLTIWAVLLLAAIIALVILRSNTSRIIDQIHYVNVNRVAKAEVLYAEAEKHGKAVLQTSEQLNMESDKKIAVPASNEHLQKSIALYNQAIELDQTNEFAPGRTIHYELLGQIYEAAGNRNGQLLTHARAFMSQNNLEDAQDNIRQAMALGTESFEPYTLQAQLYNLESRTTEAIAILDDAATSYTLTPKAYWVRGNLKLKTGERKAAITDLQEAVKMDPENLTFRGYLAAALNDDGNLKDAISTMQAGLDDGGWMDPAYLHVYGDFLSTAGNLDEAIRVLEQADELAPHSGDVQWSLARAYHRAGKARQAAAALRRATEVKPELQDRIL